MAARQKKFGNDLCLNWTCRTIVLLIKRFVLFCRVLVSVAVCNAYQTLWFPSHKQKNQKKDIGPLEKGKEHKQERNLNKKKSKTSWNTSVIMMYSKIKNIQIWLSTYYLILEALKNRYVMNNTRELVWKKKKRLKNLFLHFNSGKKHQITNPIVFYSTTIASTAALMGFVQTQWLFKEKNSLMSRERSSTLRFQCYSKYLFL